MSKSTTNVADPVQSLLTESSVKPVGQLSKQTWKAVPGYLNVLALHAMHVAK